ncbi:MAG: AI-2E family transporter [bacterium]
MTNKEHTLSWQALGRVTVLALGIFLAWQAIDVLVAIVISLILATAVYPYVKRLHKKIPLLPATIVVFTALLIPFVLFGVFVVPNIVSEIPSLIATLHQVLSHAMFLPPELRSFDAAAYFSQHSGDLVTSTKTLASGVVAVITVFFMAFYLILDNERFLGFFLDVFPTKDRARMHSTLMEVARVNGQYIRGNVIISIICALYLFIVLVALNVPFALPLAIFAGIMDLLPLIGGTLGTLPALVIGYTISPLTGTLILILHLIYQQLENVVISPAIYNKALDISPALSFISVVVGGGLFGVIGAFLALPVAASLPPMVRYYSEYQKNHAN